MPPAYVKPYVKVKVLLANPEPSTHGPSLTYASAASMSAGGAKARALCTNENPELAQVDYYWGT
jgi:hypothetical protein